MVKINFEVQKKTLHWAIAIVLILAGIVGVYAILPNVPNPGHAISELQGCESADQILKWDGSVWGCVVNEVGGGADTTCATSNACPQVCIGTDCQTKWFSVSDTFTINSDGSLCFKYDTGCSLSTTTCTKPNTNFTTYRASVEEIGCGTPGSCTDSEIAYRTCVAFCPKRIACQGDTTSCEGGTAVNYLYVSYYQDPKQEPEIICTCNVNGASYKREIASETRTRCI